MKTLELNRSFLKRPLSSITILFAIVLLYELLNWVINPEYKLNGYGYANGFTGYLLNWVFGFYLPEFVSLFIVVILIDKFHEIVPLTELPLTPKSIIKYEFKFLPLFLTAYFFFIPITLHLRFFLREFPSFSSERYVDKYLNLLYTFEGYIVYTPFVLILGYILLNASLILDFLQNLKKAASPTDSVFSAFASFATGAPRDYLQLIEAKNAIGDTLLNVNDCYLFETEEGSYFAHHSQGKFIISRSLAELENELDPDRFFRGNRNFILNLNYFDSYTYWEKGKYILHSRKLPDKDLVMPRARMQSLKESLEKNLTKSDSPPTATIKSPPASSSGNS